MNFAVDRSEALGLLFTEVETATVNSEKHGHLPAQTGRVVHVQDQAVLVDRHILQRGHGRRHNKGASTLQRMSIGRYRLSNSGGLPA